MAHKTIVSLDPRSVCNLMLDEADRDGTLVTNLALQKLLYFAHAQYLIESKAPLVSGYFEAWQYGPVHPAAYQAFKTAGDRPIDFRAGRQDPLTGRRQELALPDDPTVRRLLRAVIASFGRLTTGRLVEISHAKGAPWDYVVSQARDKMTFGLRLGDDVIVERFKHHKVSVGVVPLSGEPVEDTPFT